MVMLMLAVMILVIFQGNRGTRGARFFSPTKPIVTLKRLFLHCDPEEAADMIETYKFEALLLRDPEWQQIYSIIIKNKKYKW